LTTLTAHNPTPDPTLHHTTDSLVFLFLLAFSAALITFVFLLSTCFNKAKTAATAGTVLFFAAFFPYYALTGAGTGTAAKAAACLLAPTCLGLGSDVIAAFEGGLMGLHWDNLWVQPGETNFSYSLAVGMLLLDALLYALLAAYLEAVLPSEYGTQLPWYFPLTSDWWRRTFWKGAGSSGSSSGGGGREGPLLDLGTAERDGSSAGRASSPAPTAALLPSQELQDAAAPQPHHDGGGGPTVEPVDPELRRQVEEGRSLSLRGLRKVYQTTSGPRVAVDGLTLDLYEGQCSVLLGHNGAGKSTTIAMLTGLVPPTAGEAWVRGRRVTREMGAIRQDMGLCPQHDTLWDELTVTEHLAFFGTLKGVARGALDGEVARWAEEVGLAEKAHVEAGRLSGGMKRKLCLAMALIGGCVRRGLGRFGWEEEGEERQWVGTMEWIGLSALLIT
jgi:ATP-binding cassette, subfamily A (ABC1), member 3